MIDEATEMQLALEPLAKKMQSGLADAQALVITNDTEMERAQEGIKILKGIVKEIKAAKAVFTEPATLTIDTAKERFDPQLELAKQIEEMVKGKCIAFRNEAQQRRAVLQLQAQQVITAQAPVPEQRAAIAAVAAMSVPKTQGVSYIDTWLPEVTDVTKVPERYWIIERRLNMALIEEDSGKGTTIDGVTMRKRTVMRAGSTST